MWTEGNQREFAYQTFRWYEWYGEKEDENVL